eukprot:TRINITY_DN6891_c0_g1_i1.p1 TRINITY_DN6891_c0_g1~~TRINITY_DN6891_c0_g1_i1.p1  ORF type:complete len:151 (+),score=22.89 TRINITY_DN6891_c0_g1_i1:225-677(+)
MYIFKQPFIGGSVVPHQDSTFIYTEPNSCVALWFGLDDCTEENSCLWVLPKSHKDGIKDKRRYVVKDNQATFTTPLPEGGTWKMWDLSQFIPLKSKKGVMVLLHGACAHYSKKNTSPHSRHAYSLHIVDGKCHYPADNWLQRPETPFTHF